jgi:hypothetical protein
MNKHRTMLRIAVYLFYLVLFSCNTVNKSSRSALLPNTWGNKQLFCFSALDGPTMFSEPYTCFTLGDRFGLRLANKDPYITRSTAEEILRKRPIWFGINTGTSVYQFLPGTGNSSFDKAEFNAVTSSYIQTILSAKGIKTQIELVFVDRKTIGGKLKILESNNDPSSQIELYCKYLGNYSFEKNTLIISDSINKTVIQFFDDISIEKNKIIIPVQQYLNKEVKFSISLHYGKSTYIAPEYKIDEIIKERRQVYITKTPVKNLVADNTVYRTYQKAYSILRGNVESPADPIKTNWTTPDRSPHECMWQWDSGFHGLGWRYFDKEQAQNCIISVLSIQKENGFIPHMICPYWQSQIIAAPVLSWCTWEIYKSCGEKEFLRFCYPGLKKFIVWIQANRDENKNGLYEWINFDESMDNTPRFDNTLKMEGIDLNSFLVNDLEFLSMIAKEIGNSDEAKMFAEQKAVLSERINTLMWDSNSNFYYDITLSGEFIRSKAVSGLLPLFAGIPDKKREEILFTQVMDSTEWFTEIPFPSLSLKDKDYSLNMWRGGTWINYSYFIFRGLKRYNRTDASREVAKRVIGRISEYYDASGSIYEYYDPLAKTHPDFLPRKKVIGALHEFGWSAALYICFVNEQFK